MRISAGVLLIGLSFLSACGGGGGDGSGGGNPPSQPVVTIEGQVQKGPFVASSTVSVKSISNRGADGTVLASATTSDDLGSFRIDVESGQTVVIEGQGRFLNDLDGTTSTLPLSLRGIVRVTGSTTLTANVSVLTHLAELRIRELMRTGSSITNATAQASDDVLAALDSVLPAPQIPSFEGANLYSTTQDDAVSAYLVTISALFMESARQRSTLIGTELAAELQVLLDAIALDLQDGNIDYPGRLFEVRDAVYKLEPDSVKSSLDDLAARQNSALFAGDIFMFLDSDLDGIINVDDSDDDGDGIADVDDAYPLDWGCFRAIDGDGSRCTVAASLPEEYTTFLIEMDANGVVYLIDRNNLQIVRWSIARQQYGFPIEVPYLPNSIAYSPFHDRVFVGITNGDILAIDPVGEHTTTVFANVGLGLERLSEAGNFLLASDRGGDMYTLAADGSIVDSMTFPRGSPELLRWNRVTSKMYAFIDGFPLVTFTQIPIDQQTGVFGELEDGPPADDFVLQGRLQLSPDNSQLAAGSGDVFNAETLEWEYSLVGWPADSTWLPDGTLVGIEIDYTTRETTRLRHYDARGDVIEWADFAGGPMRVFEYQGRLQVIVFESRPEFRTFLPGADADYDGVTNPEDAFPHDPAASLDTDRDGYPDGWNSGKTAADSTTGLIVDAYPLDAACYLPRHGTGLICDIAGATVIRSVDKTIVDIDGTVYLYERAARRIHRWHADVGYQNPLVVGPDVISSAPELRYSPEQHRLYLGFGSGKMTFFDLANPEEEVFFGVAPTGMASFETAGNYVWVAAHQGRGSGRFATSFDIDGNDVDRSDDTRPGDESAWNPVLGRIFVLDTNVSVTNIWYQDVNQVTGEIGPVISALQFDDIEAEGPMRVSPDGSKLLLNDGNVFDTRDFSWREMLAPRFEDAEWTESGGTVALRHFNIGLTSLTRVEHRDNTGEVAEIALALGIAIAIHRDGSDFRLIVVGAAGYEFLRYTPSNDSDGDGVENQADAFPLDPAASVDSDADGFPDAWHTGMSEADSTTELSLDSYPNDSACQTAEQGDGTTCDIASTIPEYIPDAIEIDHRGIVYLLSTLNRRVYRFDVATNQHLNPYVLRTDRWLTETRPLGMAYHPGHDRLYIRNFPVDVTYFVPEDGMDERLFVSLGDPASGLAHAGNFLMVSESPSTDDLHSFFDSDAVLRHSESSDRSLAYTWDPALERLYYFQGTGATNDLAYEKVDQESGEVTESRDAPAGYSYPSTGPIRASVDGSRIVTGAGDVYDQQFLLRTGSIPDGYADARWRADGGIAVVRDFSSDTAYERRNVNGEIIEAQVYAGAPLAILPFGQDYVIVTDQGSPGFYRHTPSDDSDGDGIVNSLDAFPNDPAASLDSDNDGFPDDWNTGMTAADSTTGLQRDAYAMDSACQLAEHGDGTVCDVESTIPAYVPDKVEIDVDGVVYLFSSENRRVFRWDATAAAHLNPIWVGSRKWLEDTIPTLMTYHPGHSRLYFGYPDGDVSFVGIAGGNEQRLATLSLPVGGLADAGNYLMAFGREDVEGSANSLDSAGTLVSVLDGMYWSSAYAWNPALDRLYHFRDAYQDNYLMAKVVNQTTGVINYTAAPVNDETIEITGPIRISNDGNSVLIGSGNIFNADDLTPQFALAESLTDGTWLADGRLVTIRADAADTVIDVFDSAFQTLSTSTVPNAPIAVLAHGTDVVVVTASGAPELAVVTP